MKLLTPTVCTLLALLAGAVAEEPQAEEVATLLERIAHARAAETLADLQRTLVREVRLAHLEVLTERILLAGTDYPPDPLGIDKGKVYLEGLLAIPSHQVPKSLERLLVLADPRMAREIVVRLLDSRTQVGPPGSNYREAWVSAYLAVLRDPRSSPARRLALIDALRDPAGRGLLDEAAALFAEEKDDAVGARILEVLHAGRYPGYAALCRRVLGLTPAPPGGGEEATPVSAGREPAPAGSLTHKAAVKVLLAAGEDKAAELFLAAQAAGQLSCAETAEALTYLHDLRSVTEVQRQLLLTLLDSELCDEALVNLLQALGEAREARAAERIAALSDSQGAAAPADAVVVAAVRARLALAIPEERPALLAQFRDHPLPGVRLAVAELLLAEDDAGAVDTLVQLMRSKEDDLAKPALRALVGNKHKQAMPALIEALAERDLSRRLAFRDALQEHLDCFFPYRTPRLSVFLLAETSTPDDRVKAVQTLKAWLAQQQQ